MNRKPARPHQGAPSMTAYASLSTLATADTAAELAQIVVVRGQHDGAGALVRGVHEGGPVGLHRPEEVVEGRVLAKAVGIDLGGLGLGFGLGDLGVLLAL